MFKPFLILVLLIGVLFIAVYSFQRHFIYFPASDKPSLRDFNALDMQIIQIPVAKGLVLDSWYKPPQNHQPVILYLHGNAGHIGYRMYLARHFISAGLGILLLEYRGYGGNRGRPAEKGLYEDGRAAMRFLKQQGIPEKSIILYGESLGTGIATQLATEFSVCSVILQSPYASFTALARYHYWGLPIPVLDKYDSLSKIAKIHSPLLILHGKLDIIVPYPQGEILFNFANEPKKLIKFPNKGHNDLWDEHFASIVINFITKHCQYKSR